MDPDGTQHDFLHPRQATASLEFAEERALPFRLGYGGLMLELVGGSMSPCQLASFSISTTRRAPNQRLQIAAIAAEMPNHIFGRA